MNRARLLPEILTPEDLLRWMDKNLSYNGVSKKHLYTAEEVIYNKRGHCWETSELEYRVLTKLGYDCRLIYIQDKDCTITHTGLYYEHQNKYVWFEWAAGSSIKKFSSKQELFQAFYNHFKPQGIDVFKTGYTAIHPNMTQQEYIDAANKWTNVSLDKPAVEAIPLFTQW